MAWWRDHGPAVLIMTHLESILHEPARGTMPKIRRWKTRDDARKRQVGQNCDYIYVSSNPNKSHRRFFGRFVEVRELLRDDSLITSMSYLRVSWKKNGKRIIDSWYLFFFLGISRETKSINGTLSNLFLLLEVSASIRRRNDYYLRRWYTEKDISVNLLRWQLVRGP